MFTESKGSPQGGAAAAVPEISFPSARIVYDWMWKTSSSAACRLFGWSLQTLHANFSRGCIFFFSPFKSPRAWCATRLPTVEPHNWRRPIADFGSLLLIVRDWQLSRRLTSYINEWYGTIIIFNSNRVTSCRGYGGRVWRWTTSDFSCVFHFFCAWNWCSPIAFCQMQIEQNSANCC